MDTNHLVLAVALLCTVAIACSRLVFAGDPREPPLVRSKLSILGHIIGFIRYGQSYLSHVSAAHPGLPIFTVDMLVTKFYVVASPTLISGIQRNHRILSFEYFINLSASSILGIKDQGMELLREEQSGGGGLGMKVTHAMNPTLIGPGLDAMNERMITFLRNSIDQLASAQESCFDLFAWTRHAITVAATESVYGERNPYRARKIEDAFWTVETNIDKLMFGVMPEYTARSVWTARESIVEAFIKYYQDNGLDGASALANARWKEQQAAGASLQDTARLEAGLALGLLSNTVPATFWTLFEVCSRPDLLADIRAELREHALHVDRSTGLHTIDLCSIRDNCALLVSAFQETLRVRSKAMPLRMVYKDLQLNDQYLLKAGSIVQMPSPVFHRNESIWGAASAEFDPKRFVKTGEQKESRRMAGFLAFGISPSLCPGRHFATGEVLSLAAMLLLRYDVLPKGGRWEVPNVAAQSPAASFHTPTEDVPVIFKARSEYEGTSWAFRVTPGKGRFGLIVG